MTQYWLLARHSRTLQCLDTIILNSLYCTFANILQHIKALCSQNISIQFTCRCNVFSCFKEAKPHHSVIALGASLVGAGSQGSLLRCGAAGAAPPSTEELLRLYMCDRDKARCLNEQKHLFFKQMLMNNRPTSSQAQMTPSSLRIGFHSISISLQLFTFSSPTWRTVWLPFCMHIPYTLTEFSLDMNS